MYCLSFFLPLSFVVIRQRRTLKCGSKTSLYNLQYSFLARFAKLISILVKIFRLPAKCGQHNVSIKIFNIKQAILSATQPNWPAKDFESIICTFLNDNSLIGVLWCCELHRATKWLIGPMVVISKPQKMYVRIGGTRIKSYYESKTYNITINSTHRLCEYMFPHLYHKKVEKLLNCCHGNIRVIVQVNRPCGWYSGKSSEHNVFQKRITMSKTFGLQPLIISVGQVTYKA